MLPAPSGACLPVDNLYTAMPIQKTPVSDNSTRAFTGFPQAGLQFLRDLKENNDRDWFRERKEFYEGQVKLPMELLVTEAAAQCRKRGLTIHAKDKSPVMRIYRDIRFSADKRPFKTHVGASLAGSPAVSSHGEVYIHVSPDESFVAAGFWMPERAFLQAWRESMVNSPAEFLRMLKSLAKGNLRLSDENSLTRLPRGYDSYADSEISEFLKLTSFVATRALRQKECRTPGLVDIVADFGLAAKPLLEYGWKLGYTPARDILDER